MTRSHCGLLQCLIAAGGGLAEQCSLTGCRRPALLLTSHLQGNSTSSFSLRLIPTISHDTFPLAKLTPERSNLRHATAVAPSAAAAATGAGSGVKGQKKRKHAQIEAEQHVITGVNNASADSATAARLPTPQYNTSIIADMMVDRHHQLLQSVMEAVPKLREAVVLLKVQALVCIAHCLQSTLLQQCTLCPCIIYEMMSISSYHITIRHDDMSLHIISP